MRTSTTIFSSPKLINKSRRAYHTSTWGRHAASRISETDFRRLLGRCNRRKQSLQNALTFLTTIIAHVTSFVYHSGVHCYSNDENVGVLDFTITDHEGLDFPCVPLRSFARLWFRSCTLHALSISIEYRPRLYVQGETRRKSNSEL